MNGPCPYDNLDGESVIREELDESNLTPNNRPADGRICDCEDAPCCGHYE
jgi:hypothetical protein